MARWERARTPVAELLDSELQPRLQQGVDDVGAHFRVPGAASSPSPVPRHVASVPAGNCGCAGAVERRLRLIGALAAEHALCAATDARLHVVRRGSRPTAPCERQSGLPGLRLQRKHWSGSDSGFSAFRPLPGSSGNAMVAARSRAPVGADKQGSHSSQSQRTTLHVKHASRG